MPNSDKGVMPISGNGVMPNSEKGGMSNSGTGGMSNSGKGGMSNSGKGFVQEPILKGRHQHRKKSQSEVSGTIRKVHYINGPQIFKN